MRVASAVALCAVASAGGAIAGAAQGASGVGAQAVTDFSWAKRVAAAKRFAAHRTGKVSFAVVDESGARRGYRAGAPYESASVVKVMLMVAYLRQARHRRLDTHDRGLLGPMIRRSANEPASAIYQKVGAAALKKLARDAGMKGFATGPTWGASRITAAGQADFLYTLESYIPERHRSYALRLLADIVPPQRWGIPPAVPPGFHIHFKGGWAPEAGGWKINQVALLTNGDRRLALAVLTRGNPSQGYGHGTVRGLAERLLRGFR